MLPITKRDKLPTNVVIPIRTILVFLIATLSTSVILELLPLQNINSDTILVSLKENKPLFAVYGKSSTEEHLIHVFNVLQRFGFRRTADVEDHWDLLWAHDYPFLNMSQRMKNLEPYQMVNHFPGCGYITNKVDLSTSELPFLPRAFRLPLQRKEFLDYSHDNPHAIFVQKHNEHRHIFIRSPGDFNLNSSDSFIQEFLQNPFLVDGHKFDIGVYALLTSINPLRVYIYTGDVLFRYCPIKYHPFDVHNIDKYIVGDDYLPTWEVPSLVKYYKLYGGSMRASFEAYVVRDRNLDPSIIWPQVEDIIRRTFLAKEQDISRLLGSYRSTNFFDLMRFDLFIDDKLRVYLIEANMSPNLSSAHFKPNSLLYEQILYSAFNLVGIGSSIKWSSFKERYNDDSEIVTAEKNIATDLNNCINRMCDKSCNKKECGLCLPCLSGSEFDILRKAHSEHLHKTDMKRIVPAPIVMLDNFDIEVAVQNMTPRNKWMTRWFYNKCQYDSDWCS